MAEDAGLDLVEISPNAVPPVVKIMDFGLSRRLNPADQIAETVQMPISSGSGLSGTPAYMAPELTRGEPPTPASDVFALGLILYEMLTGRPAISGINILDVFRRLEHFDATEYVRDVPARFAPILREALIVDPARRRLSMAEIASQLQTDGDGSVAPQNG